LRDPLEGVLVLLPLVAVAGKAVGVAGAVVAVAVGLALGVAVAATGAVAVGVAAGGMVAVESPQAARSSITRPKTMTRTILERCFIRVSFLIPAKVALAFLFNSGKLQNFYCNHYHKRRIWERNYR
jgi:hypothetical protein